MSLRLITVGAYDLMLLDGVVGWITDDAGMSEKDSDILVRGEPSTINRKALMRGFRLWELRQLLLPGANLLAYLYQDFSVGRRYTYAKNGTSKAKVLTRVAHMAAWSPMRQALMENLTLKKHWEQIQRQRPHDVWTRERLREYWSDLERQAVEMQRQGIRDSQIAKKLRLNQATVKDWLRP